VLVVREFIRTCDLLIRDSLNTLTLFLLNIMPTLPYEEIGQNFGIGEINLHANLSILD